MAKKIYAVRRGHTTGLFNSWQECREAVHGYSGAEFKSFSERSEAEEYLSGAAAHAPNPTAEATAYVDGSFSAESGSFSYGAVIFHNGEEHEFCKAFTDPEMAAMRNVAGEIMGAEFVMRYCLEQGIKSVNIFYDYEGIEKWCTGAWKAGKPGTIHYSLYYKSICDRLTVNFVKVKGHSGDILNDRADALAKSALGL